MKNPSFACISVAFIFLINMLGTTLPTAIYPIYQAEQHITSFTITLIFATYALGVIIALLTMGGWSDQLGRKPILFLGLIFSMISALFFTFGHSVGLWLIARLFSGFSAGLYASTATVMILEIAPKNWSKVATLIASGANILGLGLGPLIGGIIVESLPNPEIMPYIIHLLLSIFTICLLYFIPESQPKAPQIHLTIQRLALPNEVKNIFVPVSIAGFSGFMVMGFYSSIIPSILNHIFEVHHAVQIGLTIFILFFASVLGQMSEPFITKEKREFVGCYALLLGLLPFTLCIYFKNFILLCIATALCGWGQGLSFRACLVNLAQHSPKEYKAAITSSFFVIIYLGMSIPVIGMGILNQFVTLKTATLTYLGTVFIILTTAIILLRRYYQSIKKAP
ncbi:MFS transporter [Acinetobacter nectaris]|uniref:MFS transporter n=1 Tax=Acinetobacter nectaris TaxID=1219382 RepID=UPI001F009557|nr:MFS transporter [Acinetobacter nectaris]MCF9034302.1 MFS transporter [Acinetobacter nectaris]